MDFSTVFVFVMGILMLSIFASSAMEVMLDYGWWRARRQELCDYVAAEEGPECRLFFPELTATNLVGRVCILLSFFFYGGVFMLFVGIGMVIDNFIYATFFIKVFMFVMVPMLVVGIVATCISRNTNKIGNAPCLMALGGRVYVATRKELLADMDQRSMGVEPEHSDGPRSSEAWREVGRGEVEAERLFRLVRITIGKRVCVLCPGDYPKGEHEEIVELLFHGE